ncbi:exopolysaccharide transport family protein [Parapedobacter sp. GCM10030251]|uniref:exopolysaccharide transport family protein n=1 Tax=Parapedobacter sp. GCM10030251 TaxID=3273419 RepID=UPI003610AD64
MIDFKRLLKYISRYWWLLILLPVFSIAVTYYFVRDMPDSYASRTLLSTNISELSRLGTAGQVPRQLYSNMLGMIRMKRVLDAVSYRLTLHDLEDEQHAFRKYNDSLRTLTAGEKEALINELKSKIAQNTASPKELEASPALSKAIEALGYTNEAILNSLDINRYGDSDFLGIDFYSEHPELSAYAVNTLANEFIQYYHTVTRVDDGRAVAFLDSLLKQKEQAMQAKNDQLRDYRSTSGILDASSHTGMLYQQITSLESSRAQKLVEVEAAQGAIRNLTNQLNSPAYSNRSALNNEVILLDGELEAANRKYIESNFGAAEKRRVDSLQQERRKLVAGSGGQTGSLPLTSNRSLQESLQQMQLNLSSLRSSITAIESELAAARRRYNAMVPMDAGLQSLERDAELATSEYMEMLNRYNQAGFASEAGLRLNVVEYGLPGPPTPSKKLIYTGLSGFASLMMCLAALTVLFLFNRRINDSEQLMSATKGTVLGSLNKINLNQWNIRNIWKDATENPQLGLYKDLIRSLRFDISRRSLANNDKILGITSLKPGAGKSFLAGSLAYAFALTGKKVLLIGDDLSGLIETPSTARNGVEKGKQEFETFLVKREIQVEDLITVLTRNRENASLFELQDSHTLQTGFRTLKDTFDFIVIDIDSFQRVNQAKEWLMFSDLCVGVFEAGDQISENAQDLVQYIQRHKGFLGWVLNKVNIKRLSNVGN